jgi:hypothetical protein
LVVKDANVIAMETVRRARPAEAIAVDDGRIVGPSSLAIWLIWLSWGAILSREILVFSRTSLWR